MKGTLFWIVIALSSIGAAVFGYHRFKQIRPDLFPTGEPSGISESERESRIADYQKKGDALSRSANLPHRAPREGEICMSGYLYETQRGGGSVEGKRVIEDGRPVRCASNQAQP